MIKKIVVRHFKTTTWQKLNVFGKHLSHREGYYLTFETNSKIRTIAELSPIYELHNIDVTTALNEIQSHYRSQTNPSNQTLSALSEWVIECLKTPCEKSIIIKNHRLLDAGSDDFQTELIKANANGFTHVKVKVNSNCLNKLDLISSPLRLRLDGNQGLTSQDMRLTGSVLIDYWEEPTKNHFQTHKHIALDESFVRNPLLSLLRSHFLDQKLVLKPTLYTPNQIKALLRFSPKRNLILSNCYETSVGAFAQLNYLRSIGYDWSDQVHGFTPCEIEPQPKLILDYQSVIEQIRKSPIVEEWRIS